MSNAFNLSQLANNVNSSGQLSASAGVTGTLPIANGGTNNASLAVTAGGVVYTDGSKLVNVGAGTSGQVLQSNGASAPTWATVGGGGLGGITVFTANGTFTIPSGKTVVKVTIIAGGGSSGASAGGIPGNGGGGGTAIKYITGLTPGNTLTVTIGNGGTAPASGANNGNAGGTSSVASGTQTITTVSATGGSGGSLSNGGTYFSNGLGGNGSGGDINIPGTMGFFSKISSVYCADFWYGISSSSYMFPPTQSNITTSQGSAGSLAGANYGNGGLSRADGTGSGGFAGKSGIIIFEY